MFSPLSKYCNPDVAFLLSFDAPCRRFASRHRIRFSNQISEKHFANEMGATPRSIVRGAGFLRMDQLKDFVRQRHSPHTGIEHNQHNSLISSYPSMESVYHLWHHLTGYEVSFLVNALLLEGDLAGYDVGCIGHRMGVPF